MKKILFALLVILFVLPLCAEEINYKIIDFEKNEPSLGPWWSPASVHGTPSMEEKIVHEGKYSNKFTYDFTDSERSGFVNFFSHTEVIGIIKKVDFWAYIDEANKGLHLAVWTEDSGGEIYLNHTYLNETGWQHVVVDIPDGPAWEGGDKNHKKDMPMSFFGIAVEGHDSPLKGEFYLDDISVSVEATPRESILTSMHLENDPWNKCWNTAPVMVVSSNNLSQSDVTGLTYSFKVYDMKTNELVDEKSFNIDTIKGSSILENKVTFNVPFGFYRADWEMSDATGLILKKSVRFTALSEKCGTNLSPALEKYLTKCGYWGGVFWQCEPEQGRDAGARWIRGFGSDWASNEKTKGKYEFTALRNFVQSYLDKGIETLLLTTLYESPKFYDLTTPEYATAYGKYFENTTKSVGDILNWYELGNEDNGSTKLIYTEIARNGAAGVRKNHPTALVANSGTAFVDVSWFKLQKERNLFDRLDVLITHPYTVTSSPEEWGVYDQGQNMINIIDEIGGYKELWSTEFGYSIEGDGYLIPDGTRANYIVRHFLLEVAAGYAKPGLYSWDGHFGIYANKTGSISLVAVQNMAKQLEGYKYAGMIENDNVYTAIYEKLGADPIAISWVKKDTGKSSYNFNPKEIIDIFGNKATDTTLSESPIYLKGIDNSFMVEAWKNSTTLELNRVNNLIDTDFDIDTSIEKLWAKLESLGNKEDRVSSAGSFHLLNALMIKARYEELPKSLDKETVAASFIANGKKELTSAKNSDIDYPKFRWAYTQFNNLEYERLFAKESNSPFEKNIRNAQKILSIYATKYLNKQPVQNQVWAYLYGYKKDNNKALEEKLSFVPNAKTRVLARVNNFANKSYSGNVSLDLPEGWTCEPEVQKVNLVPGKNVETYFDITAAPSTDSKFVITTKVDIKGKPTGTAIMNNIELLAPIILTQEPMTGTLPETPMAFKLKNVDNVSHSGEVIVSLESDKSVIGKFNFDSIDPESEAIVEMNVNDNIKYRKDWKMSALVKLDNGQTSKVYFNCDFAVATKADKPITIDGNMDDWADALPLHLDKVDYTNNSFGGSWSYEDLGATVYYKWDEKNLYMLAEVSDQTFNQGLTGASTWMQDSVQFTLTPKEKPKKFYEYCMAYTVNKEEIYMNMAEDLSHVGVREDIPISIKLSQGRAVYELAIPWEKYEAEFGKPELNKEFFFDILLNDDDAVTPRRTMERYGISIAHQKTNEHVGTLKLVGPSNVVNTEENSKIVFRDNFVSYDLGQLPPNWTYIEKGGKVYITDGGDNSNAMYLYTDQTKPDYYVLASMSIDVLPGEEYEVTMKYKANIEKGKAGSSFGACSDTWGNQDQSYTEIVSTNDWKEVKHRFSSLTNKKNIIIRANAKMELLIDNITVRKVK